MKNVVGRWSLVVRRVEYGTMSRTRIGAQPKPIDLELEQRMDRNRTTNDETETNDERQKAPGDRPRRTARDQDQTTND